MFLQAGEHIDPWRLCPGGRESSCVWHRYRKSADTELLEDEGRRYKPWPDRHSCEMCEPVAEPEGLHLDSTHTAEAFPFGL